MQDRESLKRQFCEVDLAIMPSRTEGFGLTGLEALSAGLPVLVSGNSGFGEALSKVPFGSYFVVNSDDHQIWANAIKGLQDKDRSERLKECEALRSSYANKYSWEVQSEGLVVRMISVVEGKNFQYSRLSSLTFHKRDVCHNIREIVNVKTDINTEEKKKVNFTVFVGQIPTTNS